MRMKIDVELDYTLAEPGPAILVFEAAGGRAEFDLDHG